MNRPINFETPELDRIGSKSASNINPEPVKVSSNNVKNLTENLPKGQFHYAGIIEEAGVRHGVDPLISLSVAAVESSFNPQAISSDGHESKGLFQLLDKTGRDQMRRQGLGVDYNPFDPNLNSDLGVGYLRYLHDIFSEGSEVNEKLKATPAANSATLEKLAVAAFNAGEGRVASAQQRARKAGLNPAEYQYVKAYLPKTTQSYVEKVLATKGQLEVKFVSDQGANRG